MLTVLPVALGCTAPLAGKLAERVGRSGDCPSAGMTLCAVVLAAVALGRPSGWTLMVGLGLVGVGLGLFIPPNNTAIMAGRTPVRRRAWPAGC